MIGEDIDLKLMLDPRLGRVKADPGQIEQIVTNLAVNSRDAMPQGGSLTIETRNAELDEDFAREHPDAQAGSYVMLAVSDTGVGMDADTKSRIFEPFFTTKERGKGTGLGLSTVYGIVRQSGGYILVESEPEKGAVFRVYLARVEEQVESHRATAIADTEALRGAETILVVEDDEHVRRLALSLLKSRGYTVLTAPDGHAALEVMARHPDRIHLIITDVVMPGMNGVELGVRVLVHRPGTKILYMSGYTDDLIARHGILESGAAFLEKPFKPEDLAGKVRSVLDAPAV